MRFYHTDHLGSSNVVTDATGALVELNEHTPYGALARHEGTADVAHKFTGQRFDVSTGLAFYQARYYDPSPGRFIQPDPLVPNPEVPQFLNRYSYVTNNPLTYIDPSGYNPLLWLVLLVVFVVVVAVGSEAIARQQERKFFRDAQTPPAPPPPLSTVANFPLRAAPGALAFPSLRLAVSGAQQTAEDLSLPLALTAVQLATLGLAPSAAIAFASIQASPGVQEALGAVGIRTADRLLRQAAQTDTRAGRVLQKLLGFQGGFTDRFGRIGTALAIGNLTSNVADTLRNQALAPDQKVLFVNQEFVRTELTIAGGLGGTAAGGFLASHLPLVYGLSPAVAAGILAVGLGTAGAFGARAIGDFLLERLRRETFFENERFQTFLNRA